MKLNWIEFRLMNNSIRDYVQEHYEMKKLRKMSSIKNVGSVLEIGCGSGNGAILIDKYFSPKEIIAIDLDEKMIQVAQKRHKQSNLIFQVMDGAALNFSDNRFDVIFDFGIIHHIPNWRDCIKELGRVLKPKGELILEELSIESFSSGTGKLWQKILRHPYESMYSVKEFTEFLSESGLEILNYKEFNPLKLLRHFSLNAKRK
jgi:ubiquinone/menaquinone biosynthesis C-methylase UbiE